MQTRYLSCPVVALIAVTALVRSAPAVNVIVDYTYDISGFFGSGNPQGTIAGLQARDSLESAAVFFSQILEDSFSPITVPATFNSAVSNGMFSWQWERNFTHPATGGLASLTHSTPGVTLAADTYVIYAGARNLSTAALAGPGGFLWNTSASGSFSASEISQIQSITNTFTNQVERRGEDTGFARWGGSIAFDSFPSSPWHYNDNTLPPPGTVDFYTIALHELAHALGFGASVQWDAWRIGPDFYGPNSQTVFGGSVPLTGPSHWSNGTTSTVYLGSVSQQALMTATFPGGSRRFLTELDAAGLTDIGWTIGLSIVPEPHSVVLILVASISVPLVGRRRRQANEQF
jgi:hypothetical protein